MNKIYIVMTETNEDGDITFDVLNNKFFTDKESARKEMVHDFNLEKSDHDNCDDVDVDVSIDRIDMTVNLVYVKSWIVIELEK